VDGQDWSGMTPGTQPDAATPVHPLILAGKFLVADLLSTLVFVALYAVTHSIFVAAGLAIAFGVGRIAYLTARGVKIDTMQWLSLFLVVVFGGAALFTQNPVFILLKPTLIYAAVGIAMLKPGWMTRYAPPIAQTYGADVMLAFGYVWAALMFATGAANLTLALLAGPVVWGWFIGVFPIASKVALILVQYVVTRRIVRQRIRASRALAMSVA